jgi:hypothetical protein
MNPPTVPLEIDWYGFWDDMGRVSVYAIVLVVWILWRRSSNKKRREEKSREDSQIAIPPEK